MNNSLLNRTRAQGIAAGWAQLPALQKHLTIRTLLARISVHHDHLQVALSRVGLRAILDGQPHDTEPADDDFSHLIPIKLKPVAGGACYILGEVEPARPPNMELVRAIARACVGNRMMVNREVEGQTELAKQLGIDRRTLVRILPLAWLAPDIIETVLAGRQPPNLSILDLAGAAGLKDWSAQRQALGL